MASSSPGTEFQAFVGVSIVLRAEAKEQNMLQNGGQSPVLASGGTHKFPPEVRHSLPDRISTICTSYIGCQLFSDGNRIHPV